MLNTGIENTKLHQVPQEKKCVLKLRLRKRIHVVDDGGDPCLFWFGRTV